jgi:outer membrane protein assembly factor BamB
MTDTIARQVESGRRRPLRLWPGLAAAGLLLVSWLLVPLVVPNGTIFGMLGALACALVIVAWWLFASRAPWSERLGGLALMAAALYAVRPLLHVSVRTGHMGMTPVLHITPLLCLALVAWAVATRGVRNGPRYAWLVLAVVLAAGVWTLVRSNGISGEGASDFAWRWTPTAEERLLARAAEEPAPPPPAPRPSAVPAAPAVREPDTSPSPEAAPTAAEAAPDVTPPAPTLETAGAEWSGFRGPERDGVVRGVRIETDWSAAPPKELWRRAVGPGWSSFAVQDGLLYTQEQRGEEEVVACYNAQTGEPVWRHADPVRFYESNGGTGPRGTPTLHGGRVYTVGATGVVNALDAATGAAVWSRNVAVDAERQVPAWGFSSSPLVIGDQVVVAASGQLVAYDVATGKPRWFGPKLGGGYSSPHLTTLGGTTQILLASGGGVTSVAPADGKQLWQYQWGEDATSIVQPALMPEGDVLISAATGFGALGLRRLALARGPDGWTASERWTSQGLKPYFNDFVVHEGHAYGFDGRILSCIDLADGRRKWKGGRFGHGQLVLLPEQDLLLVLSEDGELGLVKAAPDQFTELARVKAIEGKTWNHPALARDVVLVRNGEEMAAFRVPSAGR